MKRLWLVVSLCVAVGLEAQEPSASRPLPTGPVGSVKGTVRFADSRLPARMVPVILVPRPPETAPPRDAVYPVSIRSTTDLEGAFHLDGVPAGEYVVAAGIPGAAMGDIFTAAYGSDEAVQAALSKFASFSLQAGGVASPEVLISPGTVVSGRLQFADGSPVVAANIELVTFRVKDANRPRMMNESPQRRALSNLSMVSQTVGRVQTDDTGRFRLYGVAPGKYTLMTTLRMALHAKPEIMYNNHPPDGSSYMPVEMVPVFAPGTFRGADARVFDIHEGDQITDADMTIDPQGLHTLRGKLDLPGGRTLSQGGVVQLSDDAKGSTNRFVMLEEDGSFQFDLLPSGTYVVQIYGETLRFLTTGDQESSAKAPVRFRTIAKTVVIDDRDVRMDDMYATEADATAAHTKDSPE